MLALGRYRISHCDGCGLPLDESTDIENDGNYKAEPIRCHGCASIAHESHRFREDQASNSLRYRVTSRRG